MSNLERFPILQFFVYDHLPPHLQVISRPFADLAEAVASAETQHPAEIAAALRKLLEAKDCAVRAAIPKKVAATGDDPLPTYVSTPRASGLT